MNLFSALVTIAAILAIVRIARYWIDARRGQSVADEHFNQVTGELRQRIETLERIVTDQREQLKRQIDEL